MSTLKLLTDSISQVPIGNYEQNFTFIVNGEEFHTNKIVADLLSTKISKEHFSDPTINQMIINTRTQGNFQRILDLVNFNIERVEEKDLLFISEVLEQLRTENLEFKTTPTKMTIDNVIDQLLKHEKENYLYSAQIEEEIDFLSSHMYSLDKGQEEHLSKLTINTVERVINNGSLQLESEDQLLRVVNFLYEGNRGHSILYEFVDFINVGVSTLKEFSELIDKDDVSFVTWKKLLTRLTHEIKIEETERSTRTKEENEKENEKKKKRKEEKEEETTEILFNGSPFTGIFSKLKETSNINEEVNVTISSYNGVGDVMTIINSDNNYNGPYTNNNPNEWICIEVKKHQIIPTHYTVKTNGNNKNDWHPKSWVIEISNDKSNWEIIDAQTNCSSLNGPYAYHTFPISNDKQHKFKFIRMRLTDRTWCSNLTDYSLYISTFEVFGHLI